MKKMMTSVVTGAVLAGSAVVLAGSPAQAAYDDCNSGRLCLWHNAKAGGSLFTRTSSDEDLGSDSDEAHSLWNRTSVAWVLYDDKSYKDRRFCVRAGRKVNDLSDDSIKFGDKISSVKKLGSDSCSGYPTIPSGV